MIFDMVSSILSQALFGSKRKKIMSFSILIIVGFLIHMRNQRSNYENLKFSKLSIKDKDVLFSLFRKEKGMSTLYFLKELKDSSK
jgi:positive regulator of sigma E activity